MDKVTEIRKRLGQGDTSREIAQQLHASLRDIHTVRRQMGIDMGALDREIAVKRNEIEQKQLEIAKLDQEIAQRKQKSDEWKAFIHKLRQKCQEIEVEIEQKKAEIIYVEQEVRPIFLPGNFNEVGKYLGTLDDKQLRALGQMIPRAKLYKANLRLLEESGNKLEELRKAAGQ